MLLQPVQLSPGQLYLIYSTLMYLDPCISFAPFLYYSKDCIPLGVVFALRWHSEICLFEKKNSLNVSNGKYIVLHESAKECSEMDTNNMKST